MSTRCTRISLLPLPTGQQEITASATPPNKPYAASQTSRTRQGRLQITAGRFWANSAWLVCAAIAFNLTRAAGALASTVHAKATTGTIRAQLINVPGRLARSARRLQLHLPTNWPWESAWQQLHAAANSPPATT